MRDRMVVRGRAVWALALATSVLLAATPALADYAGVDPYEEYSKRVDAAQQVAPLADSIFGDQISLYDGATRFAVTDVSLPGNSGLPVALGRQFVVDDHEGLPGLAGGLPGFGDWDLDVPYIDGVFTAQNGWTLDGVTPGSAARCSDNVNVPDTFVGAQYGSAPYGQVWHGTHLHVPGAGEQELLANTQAKSPAFADAATYKWVTAGGWKVSCTGSVTGLPGEGFVAISPAGVSYVFNYAVVSPAPALAFQYSVKLKPIAVARERVFLLATEVQDRFGNWVKYTYNNGQLASITSRNGRSISVTWSNGQIATVTSAAGTWTYRYASASAPNGRGGTWTWSYLKTATRPDGSTWGYSVVSGAPATVKQDWPDDSSPPVNHCQLEPLPNTGSFVYAATAPSGATATYTFKYGREYRGLVPLGCVNNPDPNSHYPLDATDFTDLFYITGKQVNGPGLATGQWSYSGYDASTGSYINASQPWLNIATVEPYEPSGSCVASSCAATRTVTVKGPAGATAYTYGIAYAINEGQLLEKQDEDTSGNVLRATVYTYVTDGQATSEPFPDIAGYDLLPSYQNPMGNRNRPVTQTVVTQDGATFTTARGSFDAFARATSETESSSLGWSGSRAETTTYADDTSRWVLGMVTQKAVNGIVASRTSYDSLDRPTSHYAFGKLTVTDAWNGDGTLASVTDGNSHVTAFSGWYRGLPQTVTFADGTAKHATINSSGWITSLTDESGATTGYKYDAMGRLAEIDYPSDSTNTWNATKLSFGPVAGGEYGIPGGHWKQAVQTGTGVTNTYFDALWRPLVTERFDSANKGGTLSQVVHLYDAVGRTVFTSYPANNVSGYTQGVPGTYTDYDALNRVTEAAQDSELGLISTSTKYLSGFQTQVTDPNGQVTTTNYYAWGSPQMSLPRTITAPEGQTTTVTRDIFGKPRWIARNGVTYQAFVYDGHQQLCKHIANGIVTFDAWDNAGNLAWSAQGVNQFGDDGCDDVTPANAAGHVVSRTYDARNRLKTLSFPDGVGNQSWMYTPDDLPDTVVTANGSGPQVTNSYLYDARRLMTSEALTVGNQFTWVVGYGYDANGHLDVRYTPSNQYYIYLPDALGQPTELGIRNVNTYVYNVTHLPDGHIGSFSWTSGLNHQVTENVRGLPSEIHDSMQGNDAEDLTYAYDADGNPTQIADWATGARSTTATYDGLDRLTSAAIAGIAGGAPMHYAYNGLGQITGVTQGTRSLTYTYDSYYTDELVQVADSQAGTTSFGYDAQGNLASRNGVQYQFDTGNRLRNVASEEGGYAYDAWGRRVAQTSAGGTIDSFYDRGGQLIYQRDRAGGTHDYLYLGGKLVAIRDYDTQGVAQVMRYQDTDALGSVVRQTDKTGQEIANTGVVYDAWGGMHGVIPQDGPGYTGHVQDAQTNLVYMQQRYYDPSVGRFLSMDPVDASGTDGSNLDRYWYANDNPYKYIDPDGRTCTKAGKSYSCQIDYVATRNAKGKVVMTRATAADHKQYAAVEQSLTRAVNAAAASNKVEHISVKNGSATYSFSISAKKIASQLAGRNMIIDAFDSDTKSAMNTVGSTGYTNIHAAGIDPTQGHPGWVTDFGNADRTRQVDFLHEGIHGSPEEAQGFGKALPGLGREPLSTEHVIPYNNAAVDILGPNQ